MLMRNTCLHLRVSADEMSGLTVASQMSSAVCSSSASAAAAATESDATATGDETVALERRILLAMHTADEKACARGAQLHALLPLQVRCALLRLSR